jgi:hypothetical protein
VAPTEPIDRVVEQSGPDPVPAVGLSDENVVHVSDLRDERLEEARAHEPVAEFGAANRRDLAEGPLRVPSVEPSERFLENGDSVLPPRSGKVDQPESRSGRLRLRR